MLDVKRLENELINLGLSQREARVYSIMFQKKDFTAAEIQQLAGIPRTKVYEVLALLVNKGLCAEKKIGRFKKYELVKPEYAIDRILLEHREELIKRENLSKKLLEVLTPVYNERKTVDNPLDYIEVLKDADLINQKWLYYLETTEKEIIGFTRGPYSQEPFANVNQEMNLIREGVKLRNVYEYNDVCTIGFLEYVLQWKEVGEEVRVNKELPIKMMIFDEKTVMFALNDPVSLKPSLTTMIVEHCGFAKVMKFVFESVWSKSSPIEEFIRDKK